MTMATTTIETGATAAGDRRGRTLEELVDRVFEALLGAAPEPAPGIARSVHEARRLRRQGELDSALAVLASADLTETTEREMHWLYGEWLALARRRFAGREALVYSPGTGRAAVLAPHPGGALEALAVLGLRWKPGKVVSRRSLRGLRPLARGGS